MILTCCGESTSLQSFTSKLEQQDVSHSGLLVSRVLPFVPGRVVEAFCDGKLSDKQKGSALPEPAPRRLEAAFLLVDVSGFTKLSESYAREGIEGVEQFSLLVSSVFSRLAYLAELHRGDLDCFAGDAMVIVFETSKFHETQGASDSTCDIERSNQEAAVQEALACVRQMSSEAKSFGAGGSLSLHGAISAGSVYAVECGGRHVRRSEAFLLGEPLQELGRALKQSAKSEVVLAPSASVLLDLGSEGLQPRGDGFCVLDVSVTVHQRQRSRKLLPRAVWALSRQRAGGDMPGWPSSAAFLLHPLQSSQAPGPAADRPRNHARVMERLASMGELRAPANRASLHGARRRTSGAGGRLGKSRSTDPGRSGGAGDPAGGYGTERDGSPRDSLALHADEVLEDGRDSPAPELEPLLRFAPSFLRQRCAVPGAFLDMLAENRVVSVLFLVGRLPTMEFSEDLVKDLQSLLGKMIDIAEGDFGGTTRQITVDDKGLAAIFVFGLPGYRQSCHATQCLLAALRVLPHLPEYRRSVDVRAGIASGWCYCGIIGNPQVRCEYTVMGDAVNTAARLAGKSFDLGLPMLCTENVAADIRKEFKGSVKLTRAGSLKLKGKSEEIDVFAPDGPRLDVEPNLLSRAGPFIGRQSELQLGLEFASGCRGCPRVLFIHGPSGIGKTELLKQICNPDRAGVCRGMDSVLIDGTLHDELEAYQKIAMKLQQLEQNSSEREGARMAKLEILDSQDSAGCNLQASACQLNGKEEHAGRETLASSGLAAEYEEMISTGLRRHDVLVVVDGAQHVDQRVLELLVKTVSHDSPEDNTGHSKSRVILASAKPMRHVLLGTNMEPESDTPSCRKSWTLELKPFGKEAIAKLAQELLLCNGLSESFLDWIAEQSCGVPLHLWELCYWLTANLFIQIDGDGFASLRSGVDKILQFAPALVKVVRGRIDQLSQNMGIVLRCAAVLGTSFNVRLLFLLLPPGTAGSKEELFDTLALLDVANFVQPTQLREIWQFKSPIYQEVAYNCILHEKKRKLHWKAAEHIQAMLNQAEADHQVACGTSVRDRSNMEEELLSHISEGMKLSHSIQDQNRIVDYKRFECASASINQIAHFNTDRGLVLRAWKLQNSFNETVAGIESANIHWLPEAKFIANEATLRLLSRISQADSGFLGNDQSALYESQKCFGPVALDCHKHNNVNSTNPMHLAGFSI